MAYQETVVKEFESMGINGKYKCRLIKDMKGNLVIDIREYVESDAYTGFTKKGVRLGWSDLQLLEKIVPEIIEIMDKE